MVPPLSSLSASGLNQGASPPAFGLHHHYKTSMTTNGRSLDIDHKIENAQNQDPGTITAPFILNTDPVSHTPSKEQNPNMAAEAHSANQKLGSKVSLTEYTLSANDGSTQAIPIHEDTKASTCSDAGNDTMSVIGDTKSYIGADDTCLSTFSAVPDTDMTTFAKLDQSPMKPRSSSPTKSVRDHIATRTPRHSRPTTPSTSRRRDYPTDLSFSSPTSRHHQREMQLDDTSNLLDFSEPFSAFSHPSTQSPSRSIHQSPRRFGNQSELFGHLSSHRLRSPTREGVKPSSTSEARQYTNLLDYDLPPAPTPRSVPTITVREFETLKSSFLSEISSLKASLSGKEAEIESLIVAKDDAERRVGEALEEARDCRDIKEGLLVDKLEWETRDKEMQGLLREVREELIHGEKEREELTAKNKELEARCEDAESRACKAESQVAGLEASSASPPDPPDQPKNNGTPASDKDKVIAKAVAAAVDRVARELHTLYKAKHETKVGALKKSYEARWEKRIRELQTRLDDVSKENEELRISRDATLSGVVLDPTGARKVESEQVEAVRAKEAEEHARMMEGLEARMATLNTEIHHLRQDAARLHQELATSHCENSELVEQVEQMLQLENVAAAPAPKPFAKSSEPTSQAASFSLSGSTAAGTGANEGSIRGTSAAGISRVSGLKGPGFGAAGGESRIGMGMGMGLKRKVSGATGAVGLGPRSGIMSNIERMGRGRGGDRD